LPSQRVCDQLVAVVKQVLGPGSELPDPFPLERRLSELGVSSLKMVNLMLAVELEFDIAIAQADITPENFESCASILRLIESTIARRAVR
jgi:acyl carrier protein